MKLLRSTIVVALCVSLCASGCMTNMAGMAPSTTPIAEKDTYTVVGPAKGKAWGCVVIFFPFFKDDPSQTARDRAIKNSGGNALIEVCEDVNLMWLYVVTLYWTTVEGTAVKVERGAAKR
jgi:hypothetical protein